MKDNLLIRFADEEDLPTVLQLYTQPLGDEDEPLDLKTAIEIFRRIKSYPDYHVFVALLNEEIVGTFALAIMDNLAHHGAKSGLVEDVCVAPVYQGQGIGKKMMEFALRQCREKGCYKLCLSSNLKRKNAHLFYERLGFKQHGYSYLLKL